MEIHQTETTVPPPKLTLHHINVTTHDTTGLRDWYQEVLGLAHETSVTQHRVMDEDALYTGGVEGVTDDAVQIHVAETDPELAFRAGHQVNPLLTGHIAFRTDDIAAFKRHLEAQGIPYSDYGQSFSGAWHQLFFYDPTGRVIEVQQTNDEAF